MLNCLCFVSFNLFFGRQVAESEHLQFTHSIERERENKSNNLFEEICNLYTLNEITCNMCLMHCTLSFSLDLSLSFFEHVFLWIYMHGAVCLFICLNDHWFLCACLMCIWLDWIWRMEWIVWKFKTKLASFQVFDFISRLNYCYLMIWMWMLAISSIRVCVVDVQFRYINNFWIVE